ncbi:MAG: hypothetical protein AAGC68_15470, partial [Verrucomicrobiota bacterium]
MRQRGGSLFLCLVFGAAFLLDRVEANPPETVKPLRTIDSIRKLTYDEARLAPPVQLRLTVVAHLLSGFDGQDHSGGMFFEIPSKEMPQLGEAVEVWGNVTGGFYGPYIIVDQIKRHGKGNIPRPLNFQPDFIQTGLGDNRWMELEGLLVEVQFGESKRAGEGLLVTGENELVIRFRNQHRDFDVKHLNRMVGAWVEIKGTGAPLFNDRRQRIGSDIVCSNHRNVESKEQQKNIPKIALNEIGRWDSRRTRPGLVQTQGIVTLVEGPTSLIAQSGEAGARIRTLNPHGASVGESVVFTGLPETEGYFVGLRYATAEAGVEAEEAKPGEEERPEPSIEPASSADSLSRDQAMQLVRFRGKLMERQGRLLSVQEADQLVPVRL